MHSPQLESCTTCKHKNAEHLTCRDGEERKRVPNLSKHCVYKAVRMFVCVCFSTYNSGTGKTIASKF